MTSKTRPQEKVPNLQDDLKNPLMSNSEIRMMYPDLAEATDNELDTMRDSADRENEKAVAVKPATPQALTTDQPVSIESLISQAIQAGTPVDTMERLLAMRREFRAEQAKEAFDADMALLQASMPIIEKTKVVKDKQGNERYRFAPIDSIVEQVKDFIAEYGFSYKTTTDQTQPGKMLVAVTVKHRGGHSEDSTMVVPIDSDSYMSAPQKVAAASTFAKRYAFCNAFGIITGDGDTDASPETVDENTSRSASTNTSQPARPAASQSPQDTTLVEGIFAVTNKVMKTSKSGTVYAEISGNFREKGTDDWTALTNVKAWKNSHPRMFVGGAYHLTIEESEYNGQPSYSITAFFSVIKASPEESN